MRSLLVLAITFLAGFFLGHEFWPDSHSEPDHAFRFHRGRIPYVEHLTPTTQTNLHGRIHQPLPTP